MGTELHLMKGGGEKKAERSQAQQCTAPVVFQLLVKEILTAANINR